MDIRRFYRWIGRRGSWLWMFLGYMELRIPVEKEFITAGGEDGDKGESKDVKDIVERKFVIHPENDIIYIAQHVGVEFEPAWTQLKNLFVQGNAISSIKCVATDYGDRFFRGGTVPVGFWHNLLMQQMPNPPSLELFLLIFKDIDVDNPKSNGGKGGEMGYELGLLRGSNLDQYVKILFRKDGLVTILPFGISVKTGYQGALMGSSERAVPQTGYVRKIWKGVAGEEREERERQKRERE